MKRKLGLFLLAVMVAVSLGATIVASLAMYRLVSDQQAVEISKIDASLSHRFAVFETMLRDQHVRITAQMGKVLPQIAAEFEGLGRKPQDLSVAELDALVKKYGIQHIYFIGRTHRVFQTNLAYDMNLAFPEGKFTEFLDTVFGAGKVMNDGIDLSQVTGTLRTYSYFGPVGKDYIIEISTDVRTSLADSDFGWMSDFFFEEFFTDPIRSHPYLKDVDIYLINAAGTWSLLHPGKRLDPALAERVERSRREQVSTDNGRYLTIYSGEATAAATDATHPVSPKLVIREITYDTGLAREAVLQVFVSSMVVLALLLPVVFWIASRLLQKQILDPLFNLRGEAGAIAEGDLNQAIANTERSDEIGITGADYDAFEHLLGEIQAAYSAEDIAAMRGNATPEMVSYFSEDLASNASRGVVNRVSNVKLLQGDLAEAWRDGDTEYATVAMRFSLVDWYIERTTGRVVDGDPARPREATEVWTFRRHRGSPWMLSAIQQTR